MSKKLLLAVVSVFITLLLLEGGARLLIYWKYGRQDQAVWWKLDYEPYLLSSGTTRCGQRPVQAVATLASRCSVARPPNDASPSGASDV